MSAPPVTSAPRAPRRPDASMTLLTEVMQRPLDPGYAAAAERRALGDAAPRWRRAPATAVLAVGCGLLTVAGVLQLRAPAAEGSVGALRDQVRARQDRVADLAASVDSLREDVRVAQDRALGGDGTPLAEETRRLGVVAGGVPVEGPGVRLTVDDAPGATADLSGSPREAVDDSGRVTARDLQIIVNGLWAAGAEAVSLNDHRLTSLSAVRGAGEAVLVDFQPVSPPYEVEAIGDPAELQTTFARTLGGRYAQDLDQYGISVSVDGADELTLPAGAVLQLEDAEVARPEGAS